MKKDKFEKEMQDLIEDIMEYRDVAQQLEEDFRFLRKDRDLNRTIVSQVRKETMQLVEEKIEIEQNRLISIAEKTKMNHIITSLKKDIAMWAGGKVFNFLADISHFDELQFEENILVPCLGNMKAQKFNTVQKIVCDLCMQNNWLKKEQSKVTLLLLKLMLDESIKHM